MPALYHPSDCGGRSHVGMGTDNEGVDPKIESGCIGLLGPGLVVLVE